MLGGEISTTCFLTFYTIPTPLFKFKFLKKSSINLSIVYLQLNDCHITGKIMSQIAATLNNSSRQWSLLDLSGSTVDDEALREFCDVVHGNCTVNAINIASNKLTSLSLIAKLIQCLQPSKIDIAM